MPNRQYTQGEPVSFMLNGSHFGSGEVIHQATTALVVRLDADCGDSESGTQIRVPFTDILE